MMPHTKYQGNRPSGFREKIFYFIAIQVNIKHVTSGVGPFLATEPLFKQFVKISKLPQWRIKAGSSGSLESPFGIKLFHFHVEV